MLDQHTHKALQVITVGPNHTVHICNPTGTRPTMTTITNTFKAISKQFQRKAQAFGAKRLCLAPAACTVASCRRECVGPCGWLLFSAPVLKQQITKQKSREFPSPELVKKNRYTSRFGKVFNICIQTYRQTNHNIHTYMHTYIPTYIHTNIA